MFPRGRRRVSLADTPQPAEAARAPLGANTEAGTSLSPIAPPTVPERSTDELAALERPLSEIGRLADALIAGTHPAAARFSPPAATGRATAFPSAPAPGPGRAPAEAALAPGSEQAPLPASPESSAPGTPSYAQPATQSHVASHRSFAGASFSDPDPEWLAEMINEVLAEQARRHGVDLS